MSDAPQDILTPEEGHEEESKLLAARQKIEAIIKEYDLCGEMVLCGRGRFMVFAPMEATWSVMRLDPDPDQPGQMMLRMDTAQGKRSDLEFARALASTACMARTLYIIHHEHMHDWGHASAYIDEKTGATHQQEFMAVAPRTLQ